MKREIKMILSLAFVIIFYLIMISLMIRFTTNEVDKIICTLFAIPIFIYIIQKIIDPVFRQFDLTYLLEDNEKMYKYGAITKEVYEERKNEIIIKINITYPYESINKKNACKSLLSESKNKK